MNPDKAKEESSFLKVVFDQILLISTGKCSIDENQLVALEYDEEKLNTLAGLKMLHEDLELYKEEYRAKLDMEYKLKAQEKKNKDLEQFNYMASHDLKEPLRTVKVFSQLLQNNYQNLSDDKIEEYLNYINISATSMVKLLDSLLTYATVSDTIVKTKVDLNQTVNLLTKDLKTTIGDTIIEIKKLPTVQADETAIRQVLQNLISNAIKYRDPERKLAISITSCSSADKDTICVSDNGIGIHKDFQETIFLFLKRLHSKSAIEGCGIGLSVCKKLIENHGGEIWVESEVNKGAQFFFSIPK